MSLVNTLWTDSVSFLHFSFIPTRTNCQSEFLMTGTVSGSIGIMNGKIGARFFRVYTLQLLWLNSASFGIFKPGPGKQGLFKHIWWKGPYLCSTQEDEEDGNKEKIKANFLPLLRQTWGMVKENGGVVDGADPLSWTAPSADCSSGPIAFCYSSQSARHRGTMWPTVEPTAITCVYY